MCKLLSYGHTKMIDILLIILQPRASYRLWWEHTGKQTRTSHYDRYDELTCGQEGRESVSLESLRSMAQNNGVLAVSEHPRGAARAKNQGQGLEESGKSYLAANAGQLNRQKKDDCDGL